MSFYIRHKEINKFRIQKLLEKLPKHSYYFSDLIYNCIDSDTDRRKEMIQQIDCIIEVSCKIFKKCKTTININVAYFNTNQFECFTDLNSGNINYLTAYKFAFYFAGLLYIKRNYNSTIIDCATIAILSRIDEIMSFSIPSNIVDFNKITNEMLLELEGAEDDMDNNNMRYIIARDTYLLYLLMPRLDHQIVKDHKLIYEAFINGDDKTFTSLMSK